MPSLMNGFSSLGAGVASFAQSAGLEQQKADLANQSAVLADSLATTRESAGRVQAGQIASASATQAQGATAALQGTQIGATAALETQREAAAASEGAAARTAEMARTQATINAPPDAVKLLRAFGVLPDPNAPNAGAAQVTPGSGAASSATAPSATPSAPSGASAAGVFPATQTAGAPGAPSGLSPELRDSLVAHALGQPQAGSEAAGRLAIAQDVATDPAFKYVSVGAKAAEVERRFAVASAKMASPEDRHVIAAGVANYQISPLDGRARMAAGGPETMAAVMALNPKYSETNYDAIKETQKAIAPGGSLAVPVSAMNTSMGHAAHFLDLANQLGNNSGGEWGNIIPNQLAQRSGSGGIVRSMQQTAFAMAEEGNRIYAGNAGTESAIDNWYKSFPVNGSLAEQVSSVKNFAQLMGDKFDTMTGMVNKTFSNSGIPPVELLLPKAKDTYDRLISMGPDGKPPAPQPAAPTPTPARTAGLMTPPPPPPTTVPAPGRSTLATVRETAAPRVPAPAALPTWVRPGDQYSPSRGQARGADGTLYGAPQ